MHTCALSCSELQIWKCSSISGKKKKKKEGKGRRGEVFTVVSLWTADVGLFMGSYPQ